MLIRSVVLFLCILFVFGQENSFSVHIKAQKQIDIAEPSGITYCYTTNTSWVICDSCHSIYEMSHHGDIINEWRFNKTHKDIEAVTCDDENQIIHIASERFMEVTSFILPIESKNETYTLDEKNRYELIEINQFRVDIDDLKVPEDDDDNIPGLEGLTWIPKTNSFLCANEKEPPMLVTVSTEGDIKDVEHVEFASDISGLAYDPDLNLIWVLSDSDEKLFLTDLNGDFVIDSWDIDTHNPEGIAVNNDKNELYIVTDPSSPHGVQFVSALLIIDKPSIGSGYSSINVGIENSSSSSDNTPSSEGDFALVLILTSFIFILLISTCFCAFLWFREFLLYKDYRKQTHLQNPEHNPVSPSLMRYLKSIFTNKYYSPLSKIDEEE